MMELTLWQGVLLFLLWCAFVFTVAVAWHKRRWRMRRSFDKFEDEYPHVTGLVDEDGYPGGRRGRVWTELERSEYRQARERRKLRIVQ